MNPHALPSGHSFWTSNPFTAMSVAAALGGLTVDRYYSGQYMHGMIGFGHGWFGYGILSPSGGFLVIDWVNRKVSYKEDENRLPVFFKFNVGDHVVFTNEYGVCFGVKKIIEQVEWALTRDDNGPKTPRYHYEGSDTPWYPVAEKHLTLATGEDMIYHARDDQVYFQEKYGFPVADEQLAALLDNDPFEGEL